MLSNLQQKLIAEGADSQKAYNERSKYCETEAQQLGFAIKTEKGEIANLKAAIEKDTATGTALSSKIEDLSGDISSNEAELKSATGIRAKEAADFAAEEKELMETADSLERAISVLTKEMAKGGAAMLQMKSANTVTDALRLLVQGAAISTDDASKLTAFVQQSSQDEDSDADSDMGAPAAAVTENQSGGIVSVLEGLLEKAQDQLDKVRKAETVSKQNYDMLKQSLTDEIRFANQDMDEAKTGLAASKESKAVAQGDLDATSADLKGDTAAKRELHHACMTAAQEFEEAVKSRAAELGALAEAKKVIQESTGGAESATYGLAQTSFLQVAARTQTQSRFEVVRFVRTMAAKNRSPALAQLASRMNSALRLASLNGGGSPFAKVKGLITDMLSSLEEAAAADASQKAYCDKEMAETTEKKDDKSADVESLTTKVAQKSAMSSKLKDEVATLQSELAAMTKAQGEATNLRQEESAAYPKNKPVLQQGLTGVKKALKVLKDHYGTSGGSGESSGIIGLLEVVESDFSKGIAEMTVQEEQAAADYTAETKAYDVEVAGKDKDQKYKTQEFKSLDKAVAELSGDLSGNQEQLDAILEYEAKIKKQCTVMPEPYEVRKKARENEIAGLKQALTILESESFIQQSSTRRLRV